MKIAVAARSSQSAPKRKGTDRYIDTIWEELKAKAKEALEDEEKSAIYTRRKVEVESVFGHIKDNRSCRRFSLRGLEKVHTEFGIVALAHNLLKVVASSLLIFCKNKHEKMVGMKNGMFSFPTISFLGLIGLPYHRKI